MKERPILFNAEMVRAVLDGSKTQTRRIVKTQPSVNHKWQGWVLDSTSGNDIGKSTWALGDGALMYDVVRARCPFGQVGDRLWVRETWQGPILDERELEDYRQDGPDEFKKPKYCVYRATDKLDAINEDGFELNWRPSIHMPRWACRIALEITAVRVERLQDISYSDCYDEGAQSWAAEVVRDGNKFRNIRAAFEALWESTGGDWASNPWVWVVGFKRVTP